MNFNPHGINKGKVVYWINGQHFENSKDKRDGKQRAEQYCLDNFLNPNDIQKFDSRTECQRYEYLLDLQQKGLISNLAHHFTLKIQDEFINVNGDTIPPITYEADFIYKECDRRIVEDVKGSEYFLDERFITLKQVFDKLMLPKGLYIRVMLYRGGNWIEWHIGETKKQGKLIKKQREEIKQLRTEKHEREKNDRLVAREKGRLGELREKLASGAVLRSDEKKRLKELEEKYADHS